jgi:hypothetical protein
MKPYPLVDDLLEPALRVATPRAPRLVAPRAPKSWNHALAESGG